ncbi:protein Smaug homolog 1 [Macrosteles quadrilineatus]|uniref:protein Smaug homolog 1 n=1 Tax=Macrosteles quadrilineatus TaxID=74068 RepID=UPI0023E26CBA|nr:protein Smaug homolog 1 [Macrosteles quadrilineatus]XP_054263513.1 protein Smaug homolog 1 [Macrosteles quadrilineatus]
MRMYQERLATMVSWFDQWDESCQVVAMLQMLIRLPPTQARFLTIALENSFSECAELALREQEANNAGYISNLLKEAKDKAIEELLLHLPLLRPGNKDAKHRYLGVIPVLLNYCVEHNKFLDKALNLVVYTLVHPALKDDRKTFEPWRRSLVEKIAGGSVTPSAAPEGAEAGQGKIRRSNSLTPPFAGSSASNELWTSQDDLSVVRRASSGRRFSLSLCEPPPLSPQSSQASSGSGSESHLDDLRPGFEACGMRDVKGWLKSLRLHKYSWLFSQLTYAQMLSLSEETFDTVVESVGGGLYTVTQGAQRKILLSISKLRDRYGILCRVERELDEQTLLNAMDEVKKVLLTPLKPHEDSDLSPVDDLPSQVTRVLHKVCTYLLVYQVTDEEALTSFISLLDSSRQLEAFTSQQKQNMSSWRLEISQHISQVRQQVHQQHQQRYGYLSVPPARFSAAPRHGVPLTLRHNLGGQRSQPHSGPPHSSFLAKRPSLQDNPSEYSVDPSHSMVQRTHSAPPPPAQSLALDTPSTSTSATAPAAPVTPQETDPELNLRLESLCLSMTEHSLEL